MISSITTMTVDTTTVATCGPWICLDQLVNPFSVGFGVTIVSGGPMSMKVQHTFENMLLQDASSRFMMVYDHVDVTAAGTVADGNYAFPVGAVRLVVNTATSGGTARLHVRQAG